jgi:hypothetical protein
VLGGERPCPLAGLDPVEGPDPALRLRDDLVRDDQDVAVGQVRRGRVREQGGQVVAGPDLGDPGEGEER